MNAHNKCRKIHNVPAMRINSEMSALAAELPEHFASTGINSHSDFIGGNDDRKNLYYRCGMPDLVGGSTKEW